VTVHAFVDESARGQTYIVCATMLDPGQLRPVRQQLRQLLLPGQRELHFNHEKPARRRAVADRIARMPVSATLYTTASTSKTEEAARQRCLARLVNDLLVARAHRLVLDSRQHRDRRDLATIYQALNSRPSRSDLTYEHLDSANEALLWLPDAIAWCYGRRGDPWRRIQPIVSVIQRIDR